MKLKLKVFPKLLALPVYILIGAAIFVKLEKTEEPNVVVANRMLKAVQENLSLTFGVNISDQEFPIIVQNIHDALTIRDRPDWTFWKAIDFTLVALTTIGYGDIAPRTPAGQGVFIIYALIGLPLTMVTLKHTGEFLRKCVRKVIIIVEKKVFGKQEHKHVKIKCFVGSLSLFVLSHACCASMLHYIGQTSVLEGLYASFVTLSTIGFGDYVLPLESLATEYGMLGLSLMLLLELPIFLAALTVVSCFLNTSIDLVANVRHKTKVRKNRLRRNPTSYSMDMSSRGLSFQELHIQSRK